MQNLSELTRRLIEARVEFVLIGGFAAVSYGVTLVTRDVDICCRFTEANLMRIQRAFADLHPVHRSRPDLPLDLAAEQCGRLKNLYLKTDLGIVDCLSEVLGVGEFESVLRQSIPVELPGLGFWFGQDLAQAAALGARFFTSFLGWCVGAAYISRDSAAVAKSRSDLYSLVLNV